MKRILMISSVLLALSETTGARTWHVPDSVWTIKWAVEDSARYGDTVLVAPGIYDTTFAEVFVTSQ